MRNQPIQLNYEQASALAEGERTAIEKKWRERREAARGIDTLSESTIAALEATIIKFGMKLEDFTGITDGIEDLVLASDLTLEDIPTMGIEIPGIENLIRWAHRLKYAELLAVPAALVPDADMTV